MTLAINEEFFSIQGEGLHTGVPMYFVRLQGCEVGCYFCDTKYTWRKMNFPDNMMHDERDLAIRAKQSGAKWMCITGGEPYEQPLASLVNAAHEQDLYCCVETSGTEEQNNVSMDWITLSPKDRFSKKKTRDIFKEIASEMKCVITDKEDLIYYLDKYYPYAQKYGIPFIIQPVDGKENLARMALSEYSNLGLDGNFRVMMQVHKIWNMR